MISRHSAMDWSLSEKTLTHTIRHVVSSLAEKSAKISDDGIFSSVEEEGIYTRTVRLYLCMHAMVAVRLKICM